MKCFIRIPASQPSHATAAFNQSAASLKAESVFVSSIKLRITPYKTTPRVYSVFSQIKVIHKIF